MPGAARAPGRASDLGLHDHGCHVYEGRADQAATAAEYAAAALRRGLRALVAFDPAAEAEARAALASAGVDAAGEEGRGALVLVSSVAELLPDGRFESDRSFARWAARVERALADGFAGLAAAVDMSWCLTGAPGTERVAEFEVRASPAFDAPLSAICQYDRARHPPELLRRILRAHPLIVHGGRVLRNPLATPPEFATVPEPPEHEVARLLAALHERELAEDTLRQSERLHRLLTENARDTIFRYRLVPAPALEYISPACTAMTGYTPEEHYADPAIFSKLVHPEDQPRLTGPLGERVGRPLLVRMIRRDGRMIWSEQQNVLVRDEAGVPVAIEGVVRDVTERVEREERLRAAEKLASVGRLALGIGHEINNPLAWVIANVSALAERIDVLVGQGGASPDELRELGQVVLEVADGGARVGAVVRGLRQLAGGTRGEARAPVDVSAELEAALGITRNAIAPRARLAVDAAPGLPPVIAGEHEIGQVLVNLLVNAAQAIPEGEPARHEVRVSARAEGPRVVLEVRDTGAGIAPEHLPRIFDPFFTTRDVGRGSGLGLSVCHGVVTALGGEIAVESVVGRGSAFRVSLPAAPPDARRPEAGVGLPGARPAPAAPPPNGAPAAAPVPAAGARARVLVVDDEPLVGKSLARLLRKEHEVEVVTSSREALRRAEAGERWDLVLCDLMMPELSGMDLEDRLAQVAPDLVPRMLYLTGGAFTDRSRGFLDAGRPYLEKPVDPALLRARVAERVGRP
jgi:PAS domain S-box-containing protein